MLMVGTAALFASGSASNCCGLCSLWAEAPDLAEAIEDRHSTDIVSLTEVATRFEMAEV